MQTAFNRRIYDVPSFRAGIADAFAYLDDFKAAHRSGRVSHTFAERIMLAVTQVNGCRYCDWGHTRAATAAGVTDAELEAIRTGCFDDAIPSEEIPALLFAQHYAHTGGQPDPAAWENLIRTYGPDTANDIRCYVRMITIGNLSGNTFDAFLSRMVGRPAPGSTLWQELGVLLGAFVLIPAEMVRLKLRR
jgi:AhpD family alkylhydroperoxidase